MIHSARHEREGDLGAMQDLLDRSYTATCAHLLRIHTAERRLRAEQVVERLSGMCLLASPQSRPTAVPSSDQSTESSPEARFFSPRRPTPCDFATSAPVHGSAPPTSPARRSPSPCTDTLRPWTSSPRLTAGFRQTLLDIYVPRYGAQWEDFLD